MATQTPQTYTLDKKLFNEVALAQLGQGKIAYLRPILSDDVMRLFPEAPSLEPGLNLWALVNADGTPIMLTDSQDIAVANAKEHSLSTVRVN